MSSETNEKLPRESGPGEAELKDHEYDGIQEYDNPMPGWWLWIFYLSIIFAPIYMLGVHVFDFIPTYEDDLSESLEELDARRTAFAASNPSAEFDASALEGFLGNEQHIAAGSAVFNERCVVCHGPAGGGLIGPNLTDDYWIHGRDVESVYQVITDGVVEKGMTPWGSILSQDERGQLVAFIRSIEGTTPADAKAPEGELVERDVSS